MMSQYASMCTMPSGGRTTRGLGRCPGHGRHSHFSFDPARNAGYGLQPQPKPERATMLSNADRIKASELLLEAERTRKPMQQLSTIWPDIGFEDAYAIQTLVQQRKIREGRRLIGHKVGLTSKAMQRSSQINEPDYGHLLDDMILNDGAKVPHANYCVPRVEIELAFLLGKPLRGPGVRLTDVLRATEYVIPTLEIVDARVQNPRKIYDTIADNGAAAGIVMGGRPIAPGDVDLRWVGGILYVNGEIEETGLAAGVLGHPALGVAWLANKLGEHGTQLEAGHLVLAGSFTRVVWAKQGDTIHGDFGPLGSVAVQFV
jgi:2-oxo-hept-3-ene-1,7-dioate hydratase